MSLEINKGIICDLLQCKSISQVEAAVISKLNDESHLLRDRIKLLMKEREQLESKILLL